MDSHIMISFFVFIRNNACITAEVEIGHLVRACFPLIYRVRRTYSPVRTRAHRAHRPLLVNANEDRKE